MEPTFGLGESILVVPYKQPSGPCTKPSVGVATKPGIAAAKLVSVVTAPVKAA